MTHYEVLGVAPDASAEEIHRAWREKVKRLHPDAHPNAPKAVRERLNRRVADVNAAYEALRDPVTRAAYDRSLRNWQQGEGSPATGPPVWREPGPDECWVCGSAPAAQVRFRQESGRIFWSLRRWIDGPFCRTCGTAVFRELTNRTLITGWWGVVSFILNVATIVRNIAAYRSVRRLGRPQPNPGHVLSLLPLPLDPGLPLHKRAGVWVGALVTGVLFALAWTDDGGRTPSGGGPTSARRLPSVGSCVDLSNGRAVPCDGTYDGYVVAVTDSRSACPYATDYSAERVDGRIVCIVTGRLPGDGS